MGSEFVHECIYKYVYAVGSTIGPHLDLCWINNWSILFSYRSSISGPLFVFNSSLEEWDVKSQLFKILKHSLRSMIAPHLPPQIWAKNWTSYWPYGGPLTDPTFCTHKSKLNNAQNWWKPLFSAFLWRNTYTNNKKQNTKTPQFLHWEPNCTFWFGPQGTSTLLPPFLKMPLPLASLTT